MSTFSRSNTGKDAKKALPGAPGRHVLTRSKNKASQDKLDTTAAAKESWVPIPEDSQNEDSKPAAITSPADATTAVSPSNAGSATSVAPASTSPADLQAPSSLGPASTSPKEGLLVTPTKESSTTKTTSGDPASDPSDPKMHRFVAFHFVHKDLQHYNHMRFRFWFHDLLNPQDPTSFAPHWRRFLFLPELLRKFETHFRVNNLPLEKLDEIRVSLQTDEGLKSSLLLSIETLQETNF